MCLIDREGKVFSRFGYLKTPPVTAAPKQRDPTPRGCQYHPLNPSPRRSADPGILVSSSAITDVQQGKRQVTRQQALAGAGMRAAGFKRTWSIKSTFPMDERQRMPQGDKQETGRKTASGTKTVHTEPGGRGGAAIGEFPSPFSGAQWLQRVE